MAQEAISVHSLSDLKNTSDDAIPNYLNSLKFKQSHLLSDVRLALGYSAFAICAATFLWDYKFGFEATKYYTAAAVALYTILNGALTFWIWGVEKGRVYVGTSPSGDRIEISTSTKKHVPIYNVTVLTYTNGVAKKIEIKRSFTEWFDSKGHFVALPFQQMFATQVPVIGTADPRRAAGQSKPKGVEAPEGTGVSMEDKWNSLLAESVEPESKVYEISATSTATPAKSTKKRGKKA
ncbi:putative signal peptidase complex component [Xylogone sp. PMI_703]|nr:putative signal peptidase complex component [Xylogone sp. PMI_703]